MTLNYGNPQIAIAIVFFAIALLLAALFLVAALKSRKEVPIESVQRAGYKLRRWWLSLLLVLLVVIVGATMFMLPFPSGAKSEDAVNVEVSAAQFLWNMSEDKFEPGQRVVFHVTSVDVNHGFGIYDPDGVLVGQVQAMPGYTNKLDMTFNREGTYQVACLEYCGIGHHIMFGKFTVGGK